MDWNLRACGRRGHATYAPNESELRERLHVATPVGEAWRCLRCGDFAVGTPKGSGPADEAPIVLRGRALRDAVILRLLAVERFVKGGVVLLGSYGVWQFRRRKDALHEAFNENLPLLDPIAEKLHWRLENSSVLHTIEKVFSFGDQALLWITIGLIAYGVLQLLESVGLWLLRRWGEYLAVIATSAFIPIEIYELIERVTWFRVIALVINVAAVLYILLSKRLFGLRGGRAAYEAERHETSLLEVEAAATM
ncbi:MAG: DUF2127 domain-containing protein [Longispora sp.]|nr:DUF2127 domain-containing protein [Longispora sp. (in: high G+C Gram-positive bacteria)]